MIPKDDFDVNYSILDVRGVDYTKCPGKIDIVVGRNVWEKHKNQILRDARSKGLIPKTKLSTSFTIVRPVEIEHQKRVKSERTEITSGNIKIIKIKRYKSNSGMGFGTTFLTPSGESSASFSSGSHSEPNKLIELLWMVNYMKNPLEESFTCDYDVISDYRIIPTKMGQRLIYIDKLIMDEENSPEQIRDYVKSILVKKILDK